MRIDEGLKNGMRYKQGKDFDYKVQYMSIDYGSPYFLELLENNEYSLDEEGRVIYTEEDLCSYEEAREYVKDTFNVNLSVMMSEEKYNDIRARLIDGTYRAVWRIIWILLCLMMTLRRFAGEYNSGCKNKL